jgi:hypothetical protein
MFRIQFQQAFIKLRIDLVKTGADQSTFLTTRAQS